MTAKTASRTTAVLIAGIVAFAALYLASIGPYWNISPDSTDYIRAARSLAAGAGWGGPPPAQPPLTSLLFAAVVRVFPSGYAALNALTPLLLFSSLGFAYRLFARRRGRNTALLVILLSLASIHFYHATTQLLTEPLYLALSMAALLLLEPQAEPTATSEAATSEPSGPRAWLAGILMVALAMTRTIGIALALAVLLAQAAAWLRRRHKPSLALSALALVSLSSIPLWQAYSRNSYASGWFRMFVFRDPWNPDAGRLGSAELLVRVRDNLGLVLRSGATLVNDWGAGHGWLEILFQVAGTLVIVWGLGLALRRRAGIPELYLAIYMAVTGAHMIMGGEGDYRFLVPVIPLLFFFALEGIRVIGRSMTRVAPGFRMRLLLRGSAALFLLGYLRIGWAQAAGGVAEAHYSPFGDYPIKRLSNPDAQRLALWLRSRSAPLDRYAAAQRDMFDVLSERRGDNILLSHMRSREAFIARLEEGRVRYLLVDRLNRPLSDSLLAIARGYPERFRLILALPDASLYEVRPRRGE